mgnify:FL=1
MSKKNDDFFKEKKPWSEVKDQLLGCYFKPYVQKILHTYKPLVYVDCFAGKGKFEDGNPGSPLIALDIINECLAATTMEAPDISTTFIDLNYADDLTENLKGYPNVVIIGGKYEDHIKGILKDKHGSNVFLYIDPYGIKALRCSMFDGFANGQFNSIELLINLNSFGFVREACNALGAQYVVDDPTIFDDLVEYEPTKMTASDKSVKDLNEIAGGDYWQATIEDYKAGRIDGYQAEECFAEQYCQRLMDSFTYVLNMPLRIRRGQRPKYRMIHATNHRDGCLLMVDNIYNRWEAWQNVQSGGQMSLFAEDPNNHTVSSEDIKRYTIEHFQQCKIWTSLHDALAIFFMKYGPLCSTGSAKKILKDLEKKGMLQILRNPEYTSNGKRKSTFMSEGKNQRVWVRWSQ